MGAVTVVSATGSPVRKGPVSPLQANRIDSLDAALVRRPPSGTTDTRVRPEAGAPPNTAKGSDPGRGTAGTGARRVLLLDASPAPGAARPEALTPGTGRTSAPPAPDDHRPATFPSPAQGAVHPEAPTSDGAATAQAGAPGTLRELCGSELRVRELRDDLRIELPADAETATFLYRLGLQENRDGDTARALDLFSRASQLSPERPAFAISGGNMALKLNDEETALQLYARAQALPLTPSQQEMVQARLRRTRSFVARNLVRNALVTALEKAAAEEAAAAAAATKVVQAVAASAVSAAAEAMRSTCVTDTRVRKAPFAVQGDEHMAEAAKVVTPAVPATKGAAARSVADKGMEAPTADVTSTLLVTEVLATASIAAMRTAMGSSANASLAASARAHECEAAAAEAAARAADAQAAAAAAEASAAAALAAAETVTSAAERRALEAERRANEAERYLAAAEQRAAEAAAAAAAAAKMGLAQLAAAEEAARRMKVDAAAAAAATARPPAPAGRLAAVRMVAKEDRKKPLDLLSGLLCCDRVKRYP